MRTRQRGPEIVSVEPIEMHGRPYLKTTYANGNVSYDFPRGWRYHLGEAVHWGKLLAGYLVFAAVWILAAHALYGDKVPLWFLAPALAFAAAAVSFLVLFLWDMEGELGKGPVLLALAGVAGITLAVGVVGAGIVGLF